MKLHYLPWFTPTTKLFNVPIALLAGALLGAPPSAQAQTVTFAGTQTTIGSGLSEAFGVAVDTSGNVYIADTYNNRVLKETLSGNTYTQSVIALDLNLPYGLAVDRNGNVYVADTYNNRIVKEALSAGVYTQSVVKTGVVAWAVAVDSSGSVYFADATEDEILKETPSGANYVETVVANAAENPDSSLRDVAVDAQGNVYAADSGDNRVVKETLSGGSYTQSTVASGFLASIGVAVDGSGNVYVSDAYADRVYEETLSGGSYAQSTVASGLSFPYEIAVDPNGNLYIANAQGYSVIKQSQTPETFGSVAVGEGSTMSLTFIFQTPGSIGVPKVVTKGSSNLDFIDAKTGTCTTNGTAVSYNIGDSCTVDVIFAPFYPGERNGAVQILDDSGNILVSTNIYGTGTAPAVGFIPAPQLSLTGGPGFSFGQPAAAALDGSGNIFVADFAKKAVYEMLAAGGYATVKTLGGSFAFGGPGGVAVDGGGNVFVADFAKKAIYEIGAASGYTAVAQIATSFKFGQPTGVALDGNGNLFVTDLNSAVYEVLASGGYTTVNRLASSFAFNQPSGLSVEGSGDVFVTDAGKNRVYEILAAGNYTTVNQLASGFSFKSLLGVSVGASGNVFVADADFTNVFEILAPAYSTVLPLGSGFGSPWSVTVGPNGNVYVPDIGSKGIQPPSIQVIERSQPPAFTFTTTNVGSTSSNSPISLEFENVGNQPLIAAGYQLSDVADFTFTDGTGSAPPCSEETLTLTPGAQCGIGISFAPQSPGSIDAILTLTDNAFNGNPATQTLQLSGTATALPQIASLSANYGADYAITTLTGANFGPGKGASTVTFNGTPAAATVWSNTSITVTVPYHATTGNIVVTVGGKASNAIPFTVEPSPSVTAISPSSGPPGTLVTISGQNLVDAEGHGTVYFGGVLLPILNSSSTSIQVEVPSGATSGPLNVHINGVGIYTSAFTVAPPPQIASLSANYGADYAIITLTGANFGASQGSSTVTFNGASASAKTWSNTSIAVTVPFHSTTGNIVVTVGADASNGLPFTVEPSPSISGISPSSGPPGTLVTISGQNLVDAEGHGTVYLGGISLPILNPSNTSIQIKIPSGATTGALNVHINGVGSYTPTFTVN